MGATMKWLTTHVGGWLSRDADLQQYFPVQSTFAHCVITVVSAIDRLIRTNVQTMGPDE